MENETIFLILWFTVMISITTYHTITGYKALKTFPDIKSVEVVFREKWASGNSNKSFITRMVGATNILDIVITEEELWIKSFVFFAGITRTFDLLHKIPLDDIRHIKRETKYITLDFKINNELKQVNLILKNTDRFIKTIQNQQKKLANQT